MRTPNTVKKKEGKGQQGNKRGEERPGGGRETEWEIGGERKRETGENPTWFICSSSGKMINTYHTEHGGKKYIK